MVRITDRAKNYISSLPRSGEGMVWVVRVWWDRGDSDNKRSASGEAKWEHSGPRGWIVELESYDATKVTEEWGPPVAPGIYVELLTIGQTFPGGMVDLENGHLVLGRNAV